MSVTPPPVSLEQSVQTSWETTAVTAPNRPSARTAVLFAPLSLVIHAPHLPAAMEVAVLPSRLKNPHPIPVPWVAPGRQSTRDQIVSSPPSTSPLAAMLRSLPSVALPG